MEEFKVRMGNMINQSIDANSEDYRVWKNIHALRSHDHLPINAGMISLIPNFSLQSCQVAKDSITSVEQKIRRVLLTFLDGDKDLCRVIEEFSLHPEMSIAVKSGTHYEEREVWRRGGQYNIEWASDVKTYGSVLIVFGFAYKKHTVTRLIQADHSGLKHVAYRFYASFRQELVPYKIKVPHTYHNEWWDLPLVFTVCSCS